MSKNTSVTLGKHFEDIIEKTNQAGSYSSASEVIRVGLGMVEKRQQRIEILREGSQFKYYQLIKLKSLPMILESF